MYFSDTLFRFQTYLSGVETIGSLSLSDQSYILDIETIWDEYRGNGVTVAIPGGIDRTHSDLIDNYDTSYLDIFDPKPLIEANPGLILPTLFAGIIGADDNGEGLVGIAPDVTFVPLIEEAYNQVDIITTVGSNDRLDRHLSDFETAPFGRNGDGIIVVANTPVGDTFHGILGSDTPTGVTNNEFALNGLRHVITTGAMTVDNFPISALTSGDMMLVTAPVFTDTSSTGTISTLTLGLDPSDDLGQTEVSDSLGLWQVLAEAEIGEDIAAENYFNVFSGAGASSVVTGVVVLMLEANPNLGWRDVQEILAYSARQVGPVVGEDPDARFPNEVNGATDWNGGGLIYSSDYGFGAVDVFGVVRLAETWMRPETTSNVGVQLEVSDPANSANEVSLEAVRDQDLPDGPVPVSGSYSFTFAAPQDVRIEHVTLNVDYFAQAGGLGEEADNYVIRVISPNGTISDLTGEAWVFAALPQSRIEQELTSRNFWGENTDDGDGIWTVEFITDERDLDTVFFEVDLTFQGAAATEDDRHIFTDDFLIARNAGNAVLLTDTAGLNTVNAAAMRADRVLTAVADATALANGETLCSVAENTVLTKLIAGDGNDTLFGGAGEQALHGGRGNDLVATTCSSTMIRAANLASTWCLQATETIPSRVATAATFSSGALGMI